jgi:hypothetical protein
MKIKVGTIMKIEIMHINFLGRKLQHITSAGINDIPMNKRNIEALSPILAYIEGYATENGFDILNGVAEGSNIQIFLIKK